jgi:hypothetical protein
VKTFTVRLPATLAGDIEAESRERCCSRSDVVRKRLAAGAWSGVETPASADLIGSVDGLPADLSERKKTYLKAAGARRMRSPRA